MHTISLLHFGDVHYPAEKDGFVRDLQDGQFSSSLAETAAPNLLTAAASELARTAQDRNDLAALVITGDLTDVGDLGGYRSCVHFLSDALSHLDVWKDGHVFVVPGNHDVQRSGKGVARFVELHDAWNPYSYLYSSGLDWTELSKGPAHLGLASLNSCFGCGEWWGFPPEIKKGLVGMLSELVNKLGFTAAFPVVGMQLDTPAFQNDDIEAMMIRARQHGSPPITTVLTHHALLPQRLVRIEMYTELINGGRARARLLDLAKPVIYLHGHIHDDPFEVIRSPEKPNGLVLSIAAPEFKVGFNLIIVHYTDAGKPVGVEVVGYREVGYGAFEETLRHKQRLYNAQNALEACDHEDRSLLQQLNQDFVHFPDLEVKLQSVGFPIDKAELAKRLRKLDWLGLLELNNDRLGGLDPGHLHIRRTGP